MNWPKLKSSAGGRVGRAAAVLGLTGLLLGGGAVAAEAAIGTQPGAVTLSETSGSTSDTPTWSTSIACPAGYQGSAAFFEVHADGTSTNLVSPIVNGTAAPFSGTLQADLAQIQAAGGIPNGGTQEWYVECYSMQSGTGNQEPVMDTFITYSADGTTWTESGTQQVPVGEIGGIAFAALAAVGLTVMQLRRRSRRRTQPSMG